MQRWAIGSIAFILSLGLGVSTARLFFVDNSPLPSNESEAHSIETNNKTSEVNTETIPFPFTPEFTNVELDE